MSALPPPLPESCLDSSRDAGATSPLNYTTRNHALAPVTTWTLAGAVLRIQEKDAALRTVPLSEVRELRLEFTPNRAEQNRYRCRLLLASDISLEFYNRRCNGVLDFTDTSAAYAAFVRALHAALAAHAPGCRFMAGRSPLLFWVNCAILVCVALVVVGALIFFLLAGLLWVALLKVVIILVATPTAIAWVKRNRPLTYPPAAIPPQVLPAP